MKTPASVPDAVDVNTPAPPAQEDSERFQQLGAEIRTELREAERLTDEFLALERMAEEGISPPIS